MTKDPASSRATCFGIGAFCLTLATLWFMTHDLTFCTIIGCIAGFGAFDLTLFLNRPES